MQTLSPSLYEVDTYRGIIGEAVDQDFPDTYLSLNAFSKWYEKQSDTKNKSVKHSFEFRFSFFIIE